MTTTPASQLLTPPDCHHNRLITCRVDELRPHPSFVRHRIAVPASQLSSLAESGDLAFREPLLITHDRTILDGYARWELARKQGRPTLPCLEYDLPEEEALLWLLQKHRRSDGLNDYNRIVLALELEPWLKQQARFNQQLGGLRKGSSNLTEADRLDVRSENAAAAGVSTGNVSKVRQLASTAHPDLLEALRAGEISIHRASILLRKPEQQLEQLRLYRNLRGITRTVNTLLQAHCRPAPNDGLDLQRIVGALAAMTPEQKEAVLIEEVNIPGSVLLFSREFRHALTRQGELQP
jgi:ParB-like chromosome segregation protein Spo0J